MTRFVRFKEYNDWEGETWNWWLQVDGNEEELQKFVNLLSAAAGEEEYDLDYTYYEDDVEDEFVVDKLVEYSNSSYGADHTKVTGKFTCPDTLGQDLDLLYKGGLAAYFRD